MTKANKLLKEELIVKLISEVPKSDEDIRKHIIRAAVIYYSNMYPENVQSHKKHIRYLVQTQANEFASDPDDKVKMRALFNIPEDLNSIIKMLLNHFIPEEPEFMQDDRDKWFTREYPQFKIPKTI